MGSSYLESNLRQSQFREKPAVPQEGLSGDLRNDPASEEIAEDWSPDTASPDAATRYLRTAFHSLRELIDEAAYGESLEHSRLADSILDGTIAHAESAEGALTDFQNRSKDFWEEHDLLDAVRLVKQASAELDATLANARRAERDLADVAERSRKFWAEYGEAVRALSGR